MDTSASSSNEQSKRDNNSKYKTGLYRCFKALVDRKAVNLDLDVIILMIKKDFEIDFTNIDQELADILPYLFILYIETWAGWQKSKEYFSGKIQLKAWYDKFHNYILVKLTLAISKEYPLARGEVRLQKTMEFANQLAVNKLASRGSQTDNLAIKGFSPFAVDLAAGPEFINTIVFTDNSEGHVVLKKHNDKLFDRNISLEQLLSWPFVDVSFSTPVLSFSRKNKIEYRRQINFVYIPYSHHVSPFIEEINIIDKSKPRSCFTLNFLREYTKILVEALAPIIKNDIRLAEVKQVIGAFLEDVKEMRLEGDDNPTMASNTSVLFNIGKISYFRTKKLSKGAPCRTDISYNESITPKIELSLENIETTLDTLVSNLRNAGQVSDESNTANFLPKIEYGCNFCNEQFESMTIVMSHIKERHKMDQNALCITCKKPFSIYTLTENRWQHTCKR